MYNGLLRLTDLAQHPNWVTWSIHHLLKTLVVILQEVDMASATKGIYVFREMLLYDPIPESLMCLGNLG